VSVCRSFRSPNAIRLLTQRCLFTRESESQRVLPGIGTPLSPPGGYSRYFESNLRIRGNCTFHLTRETPRKRRKKNAEEQCSRRLSLIRLFLQNRWHKKTPRGVLNSNRGFVELGAFARNTLRRLPKFEFYPWNTPPSTTSRPKAASERPDPLRLARYYQSLLDSGKFESRAALARFLNVSRARVTQVLNRLKEPRRNVS
jgi:hypothetical protein